MDTKLTLKLDASVIQKAKNYAKINNTSLSRIVESYLDVITAEEAEVTYEISPFVKSIATGVSIPNDIDLKEEYYQNQIKKYR
jgi:hypothetical protein